MSIRSFKFPGKEHIGEDDIHSSITHNNNFIGTVSELLISFITLILVGMETWHLEVFILTNPTG
jgi:hypothetical protein